MSPPQLPPAYQLVVLDREVPAFARAVQAAPRGVDDGTVYWTERDDRLELAILLEPEAPALGALLAVHLMCVATGEALADLLPPEKPLAFAWPGHLLLDGAALGQVRAQLAPVAEGQVPPWLVLGLTLAVAAPSPAPGGEPGCPLPRRRAARTSLAEEGITGLGVPDLVARIGRHFLRWTGRWRADGPGPVCAAWNQRCHRRGATGAVALGGRRIEGLDAEGAFVIATTRADLTGAVRGGRPSGGWPAGGRHDAPEAGERAEACGGGGAGRYREETR